MKTVQDFQKRVFIYSLPIVICIILLLISYVINAQVNVTGGPQYSQNFGNIDITSWTNNSTFTGWYSTHTTILHQDVTAGAPSNTGGFYSYECNGDNNQKIGTRPSNTTPGAVGTYMRYGVRFVNASGFPIIRIRVSFTAYQFSLAENLGVTNEIEFHYRTSSTPITDLTSGLYTSVPALWYTAPNNHPGPGTSNQVNGYPCTVSENKEACITFSTALAVGHELMLRWSDMNNANNDPHLGIDNVTVWFYPDVAGNSSTCNTALPLEWLYFDLNKLENETLLTWGTASESNVSHFEVQKKTGYNDFYTIGTLNAKNINQLNNYTFIDYHPVMGEINYYRIKQIDWNGEYAYTHTLVADFTEMNNSTFWHYEMNGENYITFHSADEKMYFEIFDVTGRLLESKVVSAQNYTVKINYNPGIYIVIFNSGFKSISKKIVIR